MAIAVDTSALAAVVFGEPDAVTFVHALRAAAGEVNVGAATLVEARIVVEGRQGRDAVSDLERMLRDVDAEIIPLDEAQADIAAGAWRRFAKGRHPAALNLGDCFSYALAKYLSVPLLFKGNDFTQTDISSAV